MSKVVWESSLKTEGVVFACHLKRGGNLISLAMDSGSRIICAEVGSFWYPKSLSRFACKKNQATCRVSKIDENALDTDWWWEYFCLKATAPLWQR